MGSRSAGNIARQLLATLALAVSCAGLATAPAAADDATYKVFTCRDSDGKPATTDGWSFQGNAVGSRSDCQPGGDLAAGPTMGQYALYQYMWWQFAAPAATRISGYTLYRTVEVPRGSTWGWNYTLFREAISNDSSTWVERCWSLSTSCRGLGDRKVSNAGRVSETGVDLGHLIAGVNCNPAPCPAGSGPRMWIHRADFELRDLSDPTLYGPPSGDLLGTNGPVAGTAGVSFTAADDGSGVYRATVLVDDKPVASEIVDDNGGRCREPFRTPIPCRANASGTLSVDTAKLPDGPHSVRLVVTDATDRNSVEYGPVRIITMNQAPECDPAVRSSNTPVTAAFKGRRPRRSVRRRSGRATITGRIAGVGAGTSVQLLGRERREGAPSAIVASAVTGADGSFRVRAPAGPSRRLRAAYRARPDNPLLACSRALNVRVPARARLSASPRRVLPGRRVRLSGRLLFGPVPRRGKIIDFQARSAGRWYTFDTARTNSKGRYRGSYPFDRRAVPAAYPMRVRIRPDASYPYALGYSNRVTVRVR